MEKNTTLRYAFFGTGPLAESVLAALMRGGYTPSLVITKPDSPSGRHLSLTAPYIKPWAESKGIPVYQPESLKDLPEGSILANETFDLFIVASYGKILPQKVLGLSRLGTLNVHPSLLPRYRGPSPIESALLAGENSIGVSIMKLDEEVDHGPILVQSHIQVEMLDTALTLEVKAGMLGGELITAVLPHFTDGTLIPKPQEHAKATFCKKIEKEMGEVALTESGEVLLAKWRALTPWPSIYFYHQHGDKKIRVKISEIDIARGTKDVSARDIITKVIPEGKKEMLFTDFARGYGIA